MAIGAKLVSRLALGFGLVIFTFCSCDRRAAQSKKNDDPQANISEKALAKKKQNGADQDPYSLSQERALEKALSLATQNLDSTSFSKTFKYRTKSTADISTDVVIGQLFSKKQRHVLIRRKSDADVYLNIYTIKGEKLELVLFYEEIRLVYVSDTIQDVNGDQQPDFLINWYGSIGCCLKNFYNVYLFQNTDSKFPEMYEFINPTFSAKEKMVRGVGYGHPGATYLYKFRWDGFKIDTLEYIFPDKNRAGHYLKSPTTTYDADDVQEIRLKSVPKEYSGIYGYDWFLGKIN